MFNFQIFGDKIPQIITAWALYRRSTHVDAWNYAAAAAPSTSTVTILVNCLINAAYMPMLVLIKSCVVVSFIAHFLESFFWNVSIKVQSKISVYVVYEVVIPFSEFIRAFVKS